MSQEKSWQARIAEATDALAQSFVESISYDRRLYKHDIAGSVAHATMLAKVGLVSDAERDAIDGQIEGQVHPRQDHPECDRDPVLPPAVPAQLRAPEHEQHERGQRDPQEDRPARTKGIEEPLRDGGPELHRADPEQH